MSSFEYFLMFTIHVNKLIFYFLTEKKSHNCKGVCIPIEYCALARYENCMYKSLQLWDYIFKKKLTLIEKISSVDFRLFKIWEIEPLTLFVFNINILLLYLMYKIPTVHTCFHVTRKYHLKTLKFPSVYSALSKYRYKYT